MDFLREHERRTIQLSGLAFSIVFGALAFACLDSSWFFLKVLTFQFRNVCFLDTTWWKRVSDTLTTWGTFLGFALLWRRSTDPSWNRRAGALTLMGMVDVVLWGMEYHDLLGLREVGHNWLRYELGMGLGLVEMAFIAGLADSLLGYLEVPEQPEPPKPSGFFELPDEPWSGVSIPYRVTARSLPVFGLLKVATALWLFLTVFRTDWRAGWPLRPRPFDPFSFLFFLAQSLFWMIALVQVTALSYAALRGSARALTRMAHEDQSHHLFPSPSEASADDDFWR